MKLAFVPLMFLFLIVAIVLTFSVNIFGSAENVTNMSGDPYEAEYVGLTNLEHAGMAGIEVIGYLVVVAGVILIAYALSR